MPAPQGRPVLTGTPVQVPVRGQSAHWAFGTAIVGRPGSTEVVFTLPSAASRTPWARLDLVSGALAAGSGMPGPLRAVSFPGEGDDPRWWVLGLHGLGRVDEAEPTLVREVVRSGIGRYPRRLVDLGDHIAVETRLSGNVVLVSKATGRPAGRMRLPRASLSRSNPGGTIRVFAPEGGRAFDVDPAIGKVIRRHGIPHGKGPTLDGDRLYYLAGPLTPIPILAPGEPPRPGVPVVVGAGAGTVVGETVVPETLIALDPDSLEVIEPSGAGETRVVPTAVEVLGTDAHGRLVVATRTGFAIVAADCRTVLAEHHEPHGIVGAGMVAGHDRVLVATAGEPLGALTLVSW